MPHHDLAVAQLSDEIHHEERIPFRLLMDDARQLRREALSREGEREVLLHVIAREEIEGDLARAPAPFQLASQRQERMTHRLQLARPVRRDQRDALPVEVRHHVGQQVERGRVGPVNVLEEHHEGPHHGELLEQGHELALETLLRLCLLLLQTAGGGRQHAELQIPARRERLHEAGDGLARRAAHEALERLEKGKVRLRSRQSLGAATAGDKPARAHRRQLAQGVFDDRRFADPRLARHADEDTIRVVARHVAQNRDQLRTHPVAADDRSVVALPQDGARDSVGGRSGLREPPHDVARGRTAQRILVEHLDHE